jgi:hypothetical protein
MQLSRAQLDGNLDQLAADLPGLIDSLGGSRALDAFRARADDILRSVASSEDLGHVQRRIETLLRGHGFADAARIRR